MVSVISSTPVIVPNLVRLQHGSGKLSYPVRKDQSVFASFKHITAVPSSTGEGGVSVYKLRVLDNLIERLIGRSGGEGGSLPITNDNIDGLIDRLGYEVTARESALRSAHVLRGFSTGGYGSGMGLVPGTLLDTFA